METENDTFLVDEIEVNYWLAEHPTYDLSTDEMRKCYDEVCNMAQVGEYSEQECLSIVLPEVIDHILGDKTNETSYDTSDIDETAIREYVNEHAEMYNLQGAEMSDEDIFAIEQEINYGASLERAVNMTLEDVLSLGGEGTSPEDMAKAMRESSRSDEINAGKSQSHHDFAL